MLIRENHNSKGLVNPYKDIIFAQNIRKNDSRFT